MPLTLEPGCIVRRKPSTGTGGVKRHLIVTKVWAGAQDAECCYLRRGKLFGFKFRRIPIAKLDVILNSPERISAEAIAAGQPDPYASITPGQPGA